MIPGAVSSIYESSLLKSHEVLTGEINAAVEGLFEGGARGCCLGRPQRTESVRAGHHPRAHLLTGGKVSPTLELDSSYGAVIFIGQHAWRELKRDSESFLRFAEYSEHLGQWPADGRDWCQVMLAGTLIPGDASGDTASCKEPINWFLKPVRGSQVRRQSAAGFMFPIQPPARSFASTSRAGTPGRVQALSVVEPVEVKVELTTKETGISLREA